MKLLRKIVVVLVVLAGFFYLFLRTAHDSRSEPYVVERQHLAPWTLAIETAGGPTSPLLVVRPPQEFAGRLFSQIFARMMESLRGSAVAGVPIILRDEYELAVAARYTPEALLEAARAAGLEADALQPRCVALRRISTPGMTRQMYYVLFDSPAFVRFREQIGQSLQGIATAGTFNPEALAPVLIVAATDAGFDDWLPISAETADDCKAPVSVN